MACRKGGTVVCAQLTNLRSFGQHNLATKAKSAGASSGAKVARPKKAGGGKTSAKSTSKEMANESSKDKRLQMLLKVLEPAKIEVRKHTAEELKDAEARFKDYSRKKMAQHRAWQTDLTNKIRLRDAAIAALPAELRDAAEEPDCTPFPADRLVATHTPPIPGYGKSGQDARGKGKM